MSEVWVRTLPEQRREKEPVPQTMTKPTSFEVAKNLYLVEHEIPTKTQAALPKPSPTNFIFCLDVSGSMSGDLPQLREQFKKKLPKLLTNEADTLSVIWFSGKGQFGVLFEGEQIASLTDLTTVNAAVDRWLRPIGLTGFKEPLEDAGKLIERVGKKNQNPCALVFMSDGHDNQSARPDIIKAVQNLAGKVSSATFVEYGYYADRQLLASMAEKIGGQLIFAEAFDKFQPVLEAALSKHPVGGKRVEVKTGGDPIGGFAWTLTRDGDLVTYDISSGTASVPEGTEVLYYLSPSIVGEPGETVSAQYAACANGTVKCAASPAYAALSLFSVRMKPEVIFPLLKAIGDTRYISKFTNCFGKQAYSEFMEAAKLATFDESQRFLDGRDPNKVPAEDAFTVLDLLQRLAEDPDANLLLEHSEFKYSKISRGRADGSDQLSDAEQYKIDEVQAKMAGEKSVKKLKEYQAEIQGILDARKAALKFVPDAAPNGFSVSNLTYNEDRPNISVLIKKEGTVDLSSRSAELPNGVPAQFKTHIFRNYAIVRDGLVNVDKLPAVVSTKLYDELTQQNVPMTSLGNSSSGKAVLIDVKALPILNRKMVKAVSAKEMIQLEYDLTKARAAQKVYNAYKKDLFPSTGGDKLAASYGEDAAAWLKDTCGITDGGFAPKNQIAAPVSDRYTGKQLSVKLKGLSTLKSLKDVREKMASGKLTGCDAMMAEVIATVDRHLAAESDIGRQEAWLTAQADAAKTTVRHLIQKMAVMKWSIVIGQTWPTEFKSLDETSYIVTIDGNKIEGKFELREIEIEI